MKTPPKTAYAVNLHVRDSDSDPWEDTRFHVEAVDDAGAIRAALREARAEWSQVDRSPIAIQAWQ